MHDYFLHYIWQHQKFAQENLQTVQGEQLCVLRVGECLPTIQPHFFNAQLLIGAIRWVGNVIICEKSSDFLQQTNGFDPDNCILLVVYEHDLELNSDKKAAIPVLELKAYLDKGLSENSETLNIKKIIKFVTAPWD